MKTVDNYYELLNKLEDRGQIEYEVYSLLYDEFEKVEQSVNEIIKLSGKKEDELEPFMCMVSFLAPDQREMKAGTMIFNISHPVNTKEAIFEIEKKLQKRINQPNVAILNVTKLQG